MSGDECLLNTENVNGTSNAKVLYCNAETIGRYCKPKDLIYLDDGNAVGIVKEILPEGVLFEVKMAGTIK